MADKKVASLNPDDFTEGGGLLDDADVVIKEARFEMFDYQGNVPPPGSPSLQVEMEFDNEGTPETTVENYSMGSAKDWEPSEDGCQLIAIGQATSLRMSTNGGIWLKALLDAGFPLDKLGNDVSNVDGLSCHVIRVPEPQRKGIVKSEKQKAREEKYGPPTLLVVSEILEMPGESKAAGKKAGPGAAKGKTSKPASKPAASKPAAGESDGDIETKAMMAIMEILAEVGSITKKTLPAKVYQVVKDDPDKQAIVQMTFNDEFLESGSWTYEDGTLTA
jgi:hypothetical protein